MTPAELEKQRELDDLQQRLQIAKQKLTATEEFWEKEKLEAAVKAKAEELHKLDPDNQPTVLTRDPRHLEDAADRPSMYLEPSKAAADPFDGPVWIQPGEDFRITTAEKQPFSEDNFAAPSATALYILEFSPLPPGVGGRGRGGRRRDESKDDLAVIFPKDAVPALLTTRLSDEKRDWVPLFKLDARGEVPVDASPEPLKYSFFHSDGNLRLGQDNCDKELEHDECESTKTATCVLCLRTRTIDILPFESVKATIIVEDTWGYPRLRAFSYFDLVQKMESHLDQIHIQPLSLRVSLGGDTLKEKLEKLGIRITATDFDLPEASAIADFVARIMQTVRPAKPIPAYVTEEINRYLQLSAPLPKWTVLVDNSRDPVTWHIQTLRGGAEDEPTAKSFLAFTKEGRQYYVFRFL